MREVISEEAVESIPTAQDDVDAALIRESLDGQYVCPFCGVVGDSPEGPCARCSVENTPAARKATRDRIGPWYVYQHRNPAAPGMRFDTLLSFISKGKIKPRTIVRGPTTHQLWRFAAHVKGLSREFGVCYSCGGSIDRTANLCPHCNRLQEPPLNPDVLLESDTAAARAPATAQPERARPTADAPRPDAPARVRAVPPRVADEIDEIEDPPVRTRAIEPTPRKMTGDNYLSPRELAAAFNLDFTGAGERKLRKAAAGKTSAPKRKPRRTWRKIFLLLVLLAVAGGAYVYSKPDLREKARQWGMDGWKKVQPLLSRVTASGKSTDTAGHADKSLPRDLRDAHALAGSDKNATDAPPKVISVASAGPQQTSPATQPAGEASAKQQDTAPANPSTTTPTETVVAPPAEMDLATAAEKARALYNEGIDAEQRVDFTSAVGRYEQIMKLPRETWPTDLELRLKLARAQAGAK